MSQRGVPIWGILLIFVGLVLILQTFSILPWGLWFALIRMWPVLLIVLGVKIILSGRSNWIAGVLVAVLFGASLGIAFWQYDSSTAQVTGSHVQSIEGVHTASIDIRFSFGGLEVSNLPETSNSLAEVNTESGKHRSIKPEFVLTEGRGELVLSTEGATRLFSARPWSSWDARLATQVPLTLTIDASAADIDIDLRALQVNELYIDVVDRHLPVTQA
jgi:general stress protein CsbA